MGQFTGTRLLNALTALFTPLDSTDQGLVKSLYGSVRATCDITDGGTAGTAQTATSFFTNDTGVPLLIETGNLVLITPVAVTADANNKLTITVDRVDAAGANATTMATYTSDVAGGSTVAHVPKALTLSATAGNVLIPAGWTVRVAVSKAGTGVAFAAATSQAYVQMKATPAA